jgi:hypothetical protein
MRLTERDTPSRWHSVGLILTSFNRMLAGAQALAARGIRGSRPAALRLGRPAAWLLLCTTFVAAILAGVGFYHIYLDRTNLPDLERGCCLSGRPLAPELRNFGRSRARFADAVGVIAGFRLAFGSGNLA